MLKILQARLQQLVNSELPDIQAGFRKGRGARHQIANICGSEKRQGNSRKASTSCYIDYAKAFVWITINCWKYFKRWEKHTTLPISGETCMRVRKQQLELGMEQQTSSKLGKEYIKAVYCHSAYITYMQSTSCKLPGWMNHRLESRLQGEITTTSDIQMIPL